MSQQVLSLSSLVPDFGRILEVTTSSGLSAMVVAVLAGVWLYGIIYALRAYMTARSDVRGLAKLLKDISRENLSQQRRELSRRASESPSTGNLWREFDESLVLVERTDRLYNTIDAPHFFNTHTLARGLTENRLLAAMPGILTAIGVIGTFAGLQMGLSSLSISAADGMSSANPAMEVQQLKDGIFSMIAGASIAFMTSFWGVLLSVLFTAGEKFLERKVRGKINELQNLIDYLYPRITAEQTLVNIESSSKVSEEKLAELDEKIGHRLQEAMSQATESIREGISASLSEVLAPAIKQLVEGANSGSERAFESLINEFMSKMGNAGEQQQQALAATTQSMDSAATRISGGVNELIGKLDTVLDGNKVTVESFKSVADANAAAVTELKALADGLRSSTEALDRHTQGFSTASTALEGAVTSSGVLIADSATALEGINAAHAASIDQLQSIYGAIADLKERLDNVGGKAGDQIDAAQAQLAELIKLVQGQMNNFESNMTSFSATQQEALAKTTESMGKASSGVTERVEALLERVNATLTTSAESVESFKHVASANATAATQLKTVADTMSSSANALASHKEAIANATTTLNHTTTEAGKRIQQAADALGIISSAQTESTTQIRLISEQIQQVGQQLASAGSKADEGLTKVNEHFTHVASAMEKHIQDLERELTNLLENYAARVQDQTTDRLNGWNMQTQEYISAMSDAVSALSSVVDDIETKTRR